MIINEMNDGLQDKSTDKGWQAMRELLDREMPTEEKRRRFLWWWLLLLIPFASYGGYLWWGSHGPVAPPAQQQQVPSQPNPMANKTAPAMAPAAAESAIHASGTPAASNKVETLYSEPQTPPVASATTVNLSLPNTQTPGTNTMEPLSLASHAENRGLHDTAQENLTPIGEHISVGPATITSSNSQALGFIPSLLQLVENQTESYQDMPRTITLADITKVSTPEKKPSDFSFGGHLGLGTEQFRNINSFSGGLMANWQFRRRWGLRSGLLYTQYYTSLSTQQVATVTPSKYETAVDSTFIVTDGMGNTVSSANSYFSLTQAVVLPVTKLHMLELPILGSWKVGRSLSIMAGWNTAYVMAARTESTSYSGGFTLKVQTDSNNERLNELATNAVQRWRFDVQAGIGVKLNKQLELGLMAKIPLQSTRADQLNDLDLNSLPTADPIIPAPANKRIATLNLNAIWFF